jgi:hypothetical protein
MLRSEIQCRLPLDRLGFVVVISRDNSTNKSNKGIGATKRRCHVNVEKSPTQLVIRAADSTAKQTKLDSGHCMGDMTYAHRSLRGAVGL